MEGGTKANTRLEATPALPLLLPPVVTAMRARATAALGVPAAVAAAAVVVEAVPVARARRLSARL